LATGLLGGVKDGTGVSRQVSDHEVQLSEGNFHGGQAGEERSGYRQNYEIIDIAYRQISDRVMGIDL
jgi:hypothetical protein